MDHSNGMNDDDEFYGLVDENKFFMGVFRKRSKQLDYSWNLNTNVLNIVLYVKKHVIQTLRMFKIKMCYEFLLDVKGIPLPLPLEISIDINRALSTFLLHYWNVAFSKCCASGMLLFIRNIALHPECCSSAMLWLRILDNLKMYDYGESF